MDPLFLTILFNPLAPPLPPGAHLCPFEAVISEEESLADEEIEIEAKGLKPHQLMRIEAESVDDEGKVWKSDALFEADSRGRIKPSAQAPLSGSYEGVDGMGLFWSMKCDTPALFVVKGDSFKVVFRFFAGGVCLAEKCAIRYRKAPDIRRIEVKEEGLCGVLFLPPAEEPLPTVITLSGSGGGYAVDRSALLAANGFAVLSLAYFGAEGVPGKLENIPLEYFGKALSWLKKHPAVDQDKIGLYGVSRGAELALILATLFPESIKAVAAVAPSSVVYPGNEPTVAAWTSGGKPWKPFANVPKIDAASEGTSREKPLFLAEHLIQGMENKEEYAAAKIPVEKIGCPLLIISGGNDQVWPSALYAKEIEERLESCGKKRLCKRLHYPKAGHQIVLPYLPSDPIFRHPVSKLWMHMGGTPKENEIAKRDSWKKMILFFQKELS